MAPRDGPVPTAIRPYILIKFHFYPAPSALNEVAGVLSKENDPINGRPLNPH